MLRIKKIVVEPTDVYDITVPETECFFANNILVHNCAEIDLPTVPMGTTQKKLIRVKKEKASDFVSEMPKQFLKIKKL